MNSRDGYFDLQVNGYAGIDFNQDDLKAKDLHLACKKLRTDGVGSMLATIITDDIMKMTHRLTKLATLRARDDLVKEVITGIHIEGPFINEEEGYRGAHPLDAVRPADSDAMQKLLDAAQGLTRLVTLAPERDNGLKVTSMLRKQGIVVSAGHCNPDFNELRGAIDAGVSMFTHLGNACPPELPRHDNIIQRALSLHEELWMCFIADGAHIPFGTLSNYLHVGGIDRCIVVTDAIAPAGLGPGRYKMGRWQLEIGEDMIPWAPDHSHFVGSGVTMPKSVSNLTEHVGLSHEEALQLTMLNPRKAMSI